MSKAKVSAAFVKAQAEVTGAKKSATNPHFKSKYADLAECFEACRSALADNDLAVMQRVFGERLQTTLIHSSGESLDDEGVPLCGYQNAKNPMQAFGSAITYARRYGLCSMVGISPEDDDGQSLTQDKPTAKSWAGPLNADDLKAALTKFSDEISASEADTIDDLIHKNVQLMNQCAADMPAWSVPMQKKIKAVKDENNG